MAAGPSADEVPDEAVPQVACATGQWCVETSPLTALSVKPTLRGVWAISANDVYAVGDSGTILRRLNGTWTQVTSGTTANLRAAWAASASDVWVVGVGGTVRRFNGTSWSSLAGVVGAPTSDVDAIWGSGANDVWLAGSGVVTHWDGTSFSSVGFGGTMLSVSGTGPLDVWVTGENTFLHHFTGSWTTVNPGAGTSTLFSVLALSSTDVWTSDFMPNKETMHLVGGKWVAQKTSGGVFNGMSALTASDIWGVGASRVGHWTGSAWTTTQPLGTSATLWAVSTLPGHAWTVGGSGMIAHLTF